MNESDILRLAEHIARETIDDYTQEDVERLELLISVFFDRLTARAGAAAHNLYDGEPGQ